MLSTFKPLPLLGNAHVQTFLGNIRLGPLRHPASERRLVDLPDGDSLVVHDSIPPQWQVGECIVLLVHGVGGCHRSGYMARLARKFLRHGYRALRMDLRGAGAGSSLARRIYHGGCSDDVRAVAEAVEDWAPGSPLILVGMSLGGNIVLKL